ncbi:MAG: M20/M25/M40 family metallo-hydrolase [Candidatus Thermoplasmatota archaeon]|nr:M20/M25/M40 family metallo-hydrolase [Candidatus Thermoplasmatota archaeon]
MKRDIGLMVGIKRHMQDILIELIQMRSETDKDKNELIDYIRGITEEIGLAIENTADSPSPVLLAHHGKEGNVVFVGHLDSHIPGDDWNYSQGQSMNGKIYGSGTIDMKGAVVSMLFAAQELVKRDIPFALSFTTDSESHMRGAEYLSKKSYLRKASSIVVGEPTDMNVGIAEKGVLDLTLSVHGKSAHGSTPYLGDNAIIKTIRMIRSIDNFKDEGDSPLLDKISVNVATITGGTRYNMVPSRCEVGVDIRYPPPYKSDEVYNMVKNHLTKMKKKFTLAKRFELPAISINTDSEHISKMMEIAKGSLMTVEYTTEAVRYYDVNNKIVLFGCGDNEMLYQPDEYVRLEDVIKAAEIYRKFAIAMYDFKKEKSS